MKIFNKMWVIALLLAFSVAGHAVNANGLLPDATAPTVSAANPELFRQNICGDSDTTSPTVSFTHPANGDTGVALNKKIAVTFSESMKPSTITKRTFTLKKGTQRVPGKVTYVGVTATFKPVKKLETNTEYTATITTKAKDLAGNKMASDFVWSFTTGSGPDTTEPTVSSTGAANGDTGLPINRKATVVFSEVMDPLTITKRTFTLKQGTKRVSGIVTYAGLTATFTPASNLENNTEYTVTITTGAKDLAGNALASDFSVSWTTGSSTDTTAPTVSSTVPVNGDTGVPINRKPTVVFSEFMDPLTITTETYTLKQGTTPVSGIVTYAGVTATFSPLSNLENNTEYTITITTGAKDLAGNALASDFSVSWTTGSSTDTTAPTVSSTVPVGGSTGLPINRKPTVVFSEFMDPLTITTETYTLKQGTTPVSGIVTYAGVTATFTPASNLAANTEYTVTITTGAKDLAGNALASDFSVSWTTGSTADTTAPTVSSTVPVNGDTGVPINRKPTVVFSEFVDPLTITTETFTLKQGTTPVLGIVTYAGVTATFTPTSNLENNTEYTVTITTGAKDLAGNALANEFSVSWTTGSSTDTTAPTVSSTFPVNGDTGVPINRKPTVVFSEFMDPLTITTETLTLKQGTTPVSGIVTYAGVTATFTPLSNLENNTEYTVTITTGVKDLAGNALASDFSISWTTGSSTDITAPTVSSTFPVNGDTGVPINRKPTVIFSEFVDPLTITTETYTLKQGTTPVSGIVTYAGVTATFTPTSNLAANTEYTVTITTGAKDLAGNALASDFSVSWTTGSTADTTAPTVSSTGAVNGATDLFINRKPTVVFSEFMDPLTITTETFTLTFSSSDGGTSTVSGIVTYAGVTATFTPLSNLAANTTYTSTITTGANDLAGNALASDFSVSWTTGSTADTTAPTVSSTGALNGATDLPINRDSTAIFTEAMDPLTITTETFTLKQGTTPVSGIVTYAGVTATFTPLSNLENNTEYTCTITTGAKDLAGNALESDYVWSWTTGSSTDTTVPTVSSTDPVHDPEGAIDEEGGSPINQKVAVTFSEEMDPLTITTETFTLGFSAFSGIGTTTVSGDVTYSGVTAIFAPLADLELHTKYTATITAGAKDLAGNVLASDYVWNFTTIQGTGGGGGEEPPTTDTTAPTVSSTDPASGATGVALNKKPTATFSESMDPLTITNVNFTLAHSGTPATGTVAYAGGIATFSPGSNLIADTVYTSTINTGVKDLAGNALASNYVWSFTTGSGDGTFTLTANAPSITEPAAGTKAMTFVLTLGSAPSGAITVDYATQITGTAISGTDFVAATGTVTFAAGRTVATVTITVNSDATAESDETVPVLFSGTSLTANVTGTGTILKNDTVGTSVALTAGGSDTTGSLGLAGNDDTVTGTIDQNTPANGTLQAGDIFNGGDGTDSLQLTPVVDVALTLDDLLFTGVTGFDKIVINTTGTGAQIITGGKPSFYGAFGAAGVDLDTTSSTGAMTINTSSFSGATTLATTSTTGAQTITTGTGVTTVTSIATTGSRTIDSASAVVASVTLTSGDSLSGNAITTGTGNDTITIVASGTAASTIGNTITAGTGADTITLAVDASIDHIVIADGGTGITVATADSITNFTAANDDLKMGLAGGAANYAEAGVAVANFAAALTAANLALNGTVLYSFEFDITNGYLFKDTNADGTADQVVVLVGVTNAGIALEDIVP